MVGLVTMVLNVSWDSQGNEFKTSSYHIWTLRFFSLIISCALRHEYFTHFRELSGTQKYEYPRKKIEMVGIEEKKRTKKINYQAGFFFLSFTLKPV